MKYMRRYSYANFGTFYLGHPVYISSDIIYTQVYPLGSTSLSLQCGCPNRPYYGLPILNPSHTGS